MNRVLIYVIVVTVIYFAVNIAIDSSTTKADRDRAIRKAYRIGNWKKRGGSGFRVYQNSKWW